MRKRNIIDISTEEKKKEVYDILNSLTSKNQIHEYFGISDNKCGSDYVKQIASKIGFDLNIYKERKKKPIKYCKQCGNKITSKTANEFCCSSCAATYNNEHRSKDVYKNIGNKLRKHPKKVCKEKYCEICGKKLEGKQRKFCSEFCRNKNNNKRKRKNKIFYKIKCQCCNKEFESTNKYRKYCSNKCHAEDTHKKCYEDFLKNPEKYCNGGYTPKAFKKDIINEQEGSCAICGGDQVHNGKPLKFILDHIDGNSANNRRENLRCICPNCDSQLDTYKSKNHHSARRGYWKAYIDKRLKEINDL
jgi:predicted nucleic acid-binding Zn ribbon protein